MLGQDPGCVLLMGPLLDVNNRALLHVVQTVGHDLAHPMHRCRAHARAFNVVWVVEVVAVVDQHAIGEIVVMRSYAEVVGRPAVEAEAVNTADNRPCHSARCFGLPCIFPWQNRQSVIRLAGSRLAF